MRGSVTAWGFFVLLLAASMPVSGQESPAGDDIPRPNLIDQIREDLALVETMRREARYDEGLAIAQSALRRSEAMENDPLITESLYQISLLHYFMEAYEEARAYMEIGLTHARLHELETLEADLLNAQGVLEWKQGNLSAASAKLERALEVRQRNRQWVSMASIANNLGIIAHSRKEYAEAVNHYKQGLEWLGKNDNDRMRASLFSNLGESLIPLGSYEEAETYLQRSLELEKAANEPVNLAYTYLNLGELRSAQGRSTEAIANYNKALDIQLSIGNEWSAALTRLRLSEEFLEMEKPERAIEELKNGYESVKRLNTPILLRDYNEHFASVYGRMGSPELARYHKDLQQLFASRIVDDADSPKQAAERPAPPAGPEPRPDKENISGFRIATILLLVILISVLAAENLRLRKVLRKH